MKLIPKNLNGAIIEEINIYDDDDVQEGDYIGQYCSYRLVIKTNKGNFVFEGCHDSGPDIKINEEYYFEI